MFYTFLLTFVSVFVIFSMGGDVNKKLEIMQQKQERVEMIFELGKYYRHNGGGLLYICGIADTYTWGRSFIGDDRSGSLVPVGNDETNSVNWHEITKEEYITYKRSPKSNNGDSKNDTRHTKQAIKEVNG